MGGILSRFKKKKQTTFQILETLDTRIKKIEDFSRDTEQTQRTVVGQLVLYSVGLYVLAALFFYFYFFPTTVRGQLFCVTPLLVFPILVLLLKRLVQWYYHRKIERNQQLLSELKDEKRLMLENVKDNETYKVAKQILEKFAPDQLRRPMPAPARPLATPMKPAPSAVALVQTPGVDLRRRLPPPGTPSAMALRNSPNQMSPQRQMNMISYVQQRPPMPRPIIPADRGFLDKVVEYLVGDGPSNRYALICSHCNSHNGMALKEEFEYLAFQCCFCSTLNPARKQRPLAPRLPSAATRALGATQSPSDSGTDSTDESDEGNSSEAGVERLPPEASEVATKEGNKGDAEGGNNVEGAITSEAKICETGDS